MTQLRRLPVTLLSFAAISCATTTVDVRTNPATPPVAATENPKSHVDTELMRLKVSARYAQSPAHIVVSTRVQPDPRARTLTIEWWSAEGVGGSHLISLEGDRSAPRHDYAIKNLTSGEYVVTATLERNDGSRLRRETALVIIGEGDRVDSTRTLGPSGDLSAFDRVQDNPERAVTPSTPW